MLETRGFSLVERFDALGDEGGVGLESEGDVAREVDEGGVVVLLNLLRVSVGEWEGYQQAEGR